MRACGLRGARRAAGRVRHRPRHSRVADAGRRPWPSYRVRRAEAGNAREPILTAPAPQLCARTAQTAACNARHVIEQRLARWLLLSHDRMADDRVPLTHEYLALMLGIRRAGVTTALHELEGKKLIRARRGQITVTDRVGLEARSCGCYAIVTQEATRVLGAAGRQSEAA